MGTVHEANPHVMLGAAPGGAMRKPATSLPAGPSSTKVKTFGENLIQSRRKEADARADMHTIGAKNTARVMSSAKDRSAAVQAGTAHWQTGKTSGGAQAARNTDGSWMNLGKKN
jgi:hypothetical protein